MDTKTLAVGQRVDMVSGVYCRRGKVVKITSSGVDVQVVGGNDEEVFRFDNDGIGRDDEGTYECGPYHLKDVPFAERAALLEQKASQKSEGKSEGS